jgi:retron-type reverse transcriptase
MNVIEPLDRRFIYDCYACRQGKGVHRAVDRYQHYAQRYPYVLKLDISRYFPSIDHQILKSQLDRYIKDRKALELLGLIIDRSPLSNISAQIFPGDDLVSLSERRYGIPIGNLTSQFFANLYLNEFDHWLKEQQQLKAYIRYVDDLFILGDDKTQLWRLRNAITRELMALRLQLHPLKAQICRTSEHVDVLGYKVSRTRRWLRNDNGYRFRRKLNNMAALYHQERLDWTEVNASVQSWIGHARHGETEGLRKAIFSNVVFKRGAGQDVASA